MLKFHNRLKYVSEKLNLSPRKFSVSLGKSESWFSSLIRQQSDISSSDLIKLEEVHSINPMYILKGEMPIFLKNRDGSK